MVAVACVASRKRVLAACSLMLFVILAGSRSDAEQPLTSSEYFAIQVVDRQTGRGVPLVELRTTNMVRYFTDSHGFVAFLEPGLMDREVFFFVESHGYTFPKDGFGSQGIRLRTTPGASATVKVDRVNIAERLYRVTGQGIYRDSVLLGRAVPLENPVLNGQVMGQDSVFTCLYRGRIFWMWGDTGKPSYPLGNFAMSGAVSDLPGRGGLDPAVGVDLEYFVGEDGFSRKMAPLKEPGLVWLDGLMTVPDPQGNERMIAKFARLKGLDETLERGLMVYNDQTDTFEPIVRPGLEFLPYRNTGHAFPAQVTGQPYYYFTTPSPMGARMRVPARWDAVIDANQYEVLTALAPEAPTVSRATSDERRDSSCRWVRFGDVLAWYDGDKAAAIEALEAEAKGLRVYDVETGRDIVPHNGTVYFNAHRNRWIGVFTQLYGESSALGEIWYAEADMPVGPWAYARKIITHDKYSFYNPKQHPLFDQDGGRTIYLEGTYTWTFSGSEERATPRYDYNQIMYRLNLDDPRLTLPVAVYEVVDEQGQRNYVLAKEVERLGHWDAVQSVAFYAMASSRALENLVPVHRTPVQVTAENIAAVRLEAGNKQRGFGPLVYALPADETQTQNPRIVPLYEYRRTDSEQRLYSTDVQVEGWTRADRPLCRVWKTPPGLLLIDAAAKPPAR